MDDVTKLSAEELIESLDRTLIKASVLEVCETLLSDAHIRVPGFAECVNTFLGEARPLYDEIQRRIKAFVPASSPE